MVEIIKEHGTAKEYNKGCRCELCKKAKAVYRTNTPIKGHGTKWYYSKGCRCDLCREATNIAKRKYLGRQPKKITTNVIKGTRICYVCKEEKLLDEFTRNSNSRAFMGRSNECKACQRKRGAITRKTSPKQRFSAYKYNARQRNIEFNLTFEEFYTFWERPCYYCNDPIKGIGIDRINSDGAYNLENVVPCCSVCNYAKKSHTSEQFISMCMKVAENFKNIIVSPKESSEL
jgi:hypothetical protein